ncbi:LOW QUALITY PROTEIN: hypothetical protein HID58_084846, partial [Brassica napus]
VSSRFGLTLFTAELALNQLLRRGTRSPTRSIESRRKSGMTERFCRIFSDSRESPVITEHFSPEKMTSRFSNLILKPGRKRLTVIVSLFQTGNVELKIDCAGLLEFITVDGESKLLIAERDGLVTELTKSMNGDSDPRLIEASLSFLIAISSPKRVKLDLIREKVITNLTKLLTDDATAFSVTEKCLKLLESLASTKEGRLVIYGGDGECLKTVVKKADESIDGGDGACRDGCLEQKALEAVMSTNGVTKILLLLQSNCSAAVRRMLTDLLKVF